MNDVRCPRCGGSVPPNAAFCGLCGAPIAAQQPAEQPAQQPAPPPAGSTPPQGWQPPAPYQPAANLPPPTSGYIPLQGPGPKILGNNTKWALGLGVAAIFCCGPFTGIPGIIMAKKDMDDIAAGRAPQLDDTWAKVAFYLNIGAMVLFVVGLCLFWGTAGMRRIL